MKIAVSQINTTIGDFSGNAEIMLSEIKWASASGADLVVFPELTTTGYPPRDLLEKPLFIEKNLECVHTVAKASEDIGVVMGFAQPNEDQTGRGLFNVAAFLHRGTVEFVQEKSLLPEYDVFDEARHFEPARTHRVYEFQGVKLALSLCEDIWSSFTFEGRQLYRSDPIQAFVQCGAEIIINISASPYVLGKDKIREVLARRTARLTGKPLIYCNLVGGNDALIFDGQSMVVDGSGEIVKRAKRFEQDHFIIDTQSMKAEGEAGEEDDVSEIRRAIVLGICDYMRKCGFEKAVIGISGGVDSAVVAALACEAIGAKNVVGVLMPSPYTSRTSIQDAEHLAKNLGIKIRSISIGKIYEAYRKTLGFDGRKDISVAEENLQARARGKILMAISNQEGELLLSTGNKSEMSVGYCTLYGDMAGGLAVISDVPKTMVFELARNFNGEKEMIPQSIIDKPPSAELKPEQSDTDSLPPYEILDKILKLYIEDHISSRSIIDMGFDRDTVLKVVRMVDFNEYKRRQAPPGLKVTSKAFGSGRRFPIARKMFW